MADRIDVYAQALLDIVSAEGHVDEVEDELFRFARIVEGNDELRMTLSNPGLPLDQRSAIVDDLLQNRALPTTRALATFIVAAGRGHDLPAIVDRFVELAAETREHVVAEVRSAVALDDGQRARIAEALSRTTGKQVEVKSRRRRVGARRHRRHDRRHRDRRHRSPPSRTVEGENVNEASVHEAGALPPRSEPGPERPDRAENTCLN